jgi:hypothetical protein
MGKGISGCTNFCIGPHSSWERLDADGSALWARLLRRPRTPVDHRKARPDPSRARLPCLSGTAWNETFTHTAGSEIIDRVHEETDHRQSPASNA